MTPLVATHALAAGFGLVVGGWQLFLSAKGSPAHRVAGRAWVLALLYVSVSSFWIREIRDGAFSLLHVLSVVTIVTVLLGLVAAVRGHLESHRGNMTGSWLGLVGAGVAASAVPDRDLPQLVVHSPGTAALAVLVVLAASAAVVGLGGRLARVRPATPVAGAGVRTGWRAGGSGR